MKKTEEETSGIPRMPSCGSGISRRDFVKAAAAGSGMMLIECTPAKPSQEKGGNRYDWTKHRWAFVVDITKCIGCCACMRACRAENKVPKGYYRTWIERYRIDKSGKVKVDVAKDEQGFEPAPMKDLKASFFVPKLCNHCEASPCTQVCPVGACYTTKDGVVLVDEEYCIGCGYCVQACPYGTRFMTPDSHVASKCTLCYHRITKGLLPACVQACPTGARLFGDLKDPDSELVKFLRSRPHRTLRPELGTKPNVHYMGLKSWVV